jgi:hypothetical protein
MEKGSSIIDSLSTKSADKFRKKVQKETTDKKTRSETESWYADAEASASWGFGSASVKAGAKGEYHAGREEFAKNVTESAREHANEASANREITITSSSERSEEREKEVVIERTIKNVNMRRVLNFVFRELNQEYIVKTHLKDIKVAFSNGRLGSWREVPLSGLRVLLQEVLKPEKIDEVAKAILGVVGVIFDKDDKPINALETMKLTVVPDSTDPLIGHPKWEIGTATLTRPNPQSQEWEYEAPNDTLLYRFKRGPLGQDEESNGQNGESNGQNGESNGQDGESNKVDGVLMNETTITMRTDSVIVEALLGQADALDDYAMEVQKAAAGAKTLENEREKIAHDILKAITDAKEQAEAYAKMFKVEEVKEEVE